MLSEEKITSVCTLFEGHYHHGVAVLINSLYNQGYRGAVYAGYRGELPSWCAGATVNTSLPGEDGRSLEVADGLILHLMRLTTDYHLTNYKPNFMMDLWKGPAKDAVAMFYFDPDIVVCGPWTFFEEWARCGVALCEDVNSPLPENHPRRAAWRRYFHKRGVTLTYKTAVYVNGGYIGVARTDQRFLGIWKTLQEAMAPAIGGLACSALPGKALQAESRGPFSPFGKTDQDALNAAVEAWDGDVSIIGQEGMSIKSGAALLPHALGHPKPWKWNPLLQAISGRPPRRADREYWKNAKGIVTSHGPVMVRTMLLSIKIASLICRFYRRR